MSIVSPPCRCRRLGFGVCTGMVGRGHPLEMGLLSSLGEEPRDVLEGAISTGREMMP